MKNDPVCVVLCFPMNDNSVTVYMVARMSFSYRTTNSLPSLSNILSPAYLKKSTFCPTVTPTGLTSLESLSLFSSSFLPGPVDSTVPVMGFSTAPDVSMMPPLVVDMASSTCSSTRSPVGMSLGMSLAVAPEPGNVPIRSASRIMMNVSPPISMSVHPMPNLLYSTVTPTFISLHSSPTATTSPEVGLRCADSASRIPPLVCFSA
mmetsp:Transcript_33066/g.81322  ORF Transcript_33066/g.81322 Transcript_33066/m.81322 type:complete len:205 (+) Transcript_33066:66-680(+)